MGRARNRVVQDRTGNRRRRRRRRRRRGAADGKGATAAAVVASTNKGVVTTTGRVVVDDGTSGTTGRTTRGTVLVGTHVRAMMMMKHPLLAPLRGYREPPSHVGRTVRRRRLGRLGRRRGLGSGFLGSGGGRCRRRVRRRPCSVQEVRHVPTVQCIPRSSTQVGVRSSRHGVAVGVPRNPYIKTGPPPYRTERPFHP